MALSSWYRWALIGVAPTAGCRESPPALNSPPPPPPGLATVAVSPNGQVIGVGDSLLFHATTNLTGSTGFDWAVSNATLATISSQGWVRGVKPGDLLVRACLLPSLTACGAANLSIR